MPPIRVAILDMYQNFPNEGMRCIRQLLRRAEAENDVSFEVVTFNVRAENEVPDLEFDFYISTGGPGSPLVSDEPWEPKYFAFIDALFAHNAHSAIKKHLLLICHSFQLVSRHLELGTISKRRSTSFGVMPVRLTPAGAADPLLAALPDPFFIVDSRDYQLTDLNEARMSATGTQLLCLEKERPTVPLARAVMALRFTAEVFGTQFHPEADGEGMLRYLLTDEKKQQVVGQHGEAKYNDMIRQLADPSTIELTESIIVPSFLRRAIAAVPELALM